eukprot:373-Eustigmatos_ZCMA.PRE.1
MVATSWHDPEGPEGKPCTFQHVWDGTARADSEQRYLMNRYLLLTCKDHHALAWVRPEHLDLVRED